MAEHARIKLLNSARTFLQEWIQPFPEEIFVLLREKNIRGAVKVLDALMYGVCDRHRP